MSAAMSPSPPKTLRILCLGASLVAGFSSMGNVYHPWTHSLVKALQIQLPGTEIETVVDGIPGDRVTSGTFLKRMKKQFSEGSKPFDWTIVLGATNDLGFYIEPELIMKKFKEIWAIPLSHGSKVLALTVPRVKGDEAFPQIVQPRNALNTMIREYRADEFHVFDLHDELPCEGQNVQYWDDAVHFTPAGYDVIGAKLAVALLGLMAADK